MIHSFKGSTIFHIKLLIILAVQLMHLHSSEKMDFNAMAPLHIMHYNNPDLEEREDWDLFSTHLEDCKKIGIDAFGKGSSNLTFGQFSAK